MNSSELYHHIFRLLPLPALVLKPDAPHFTIVDANSSFREITDIDPEKLPGMHFFAIFPGNPENPNDTDAQKMLRSLQKVVETGKEDLLGVQNYITKNPETGKIESQYYDPKNFPVLNESGNVEYIIHTVANITESVIQKDELEKSENRFKSLVENSTDAIFIYNKEIEPLYVTPSVEQILGYTAEEIYNSDLLGAIHPDDIQDLESFIKTCLENPGMPIAVKPVRMKHKNGTYRWLEGTLTNMLNNPAIGGIVDNFRDITERIETEREIEQTTQKLEGLIQTIDGIIWEANAADFLFTYVSPQSLEILGYSPEEWVGVPEFWSSKIHPDERDFIVNYCHRETRKGNNHAFEYRMQKADGEYIWIRDVVSVITENGTPVALRGLMLDINRRKELELQLKQAYEIAGIGSWSLDLVSQKLTWSDFVKEIHEVAPGYEPDLESAIAFYEEGKHREKITLAVNKAIKNGKEFDLELKIITAKGNERWVRAVGKPEIISGTCMRLFGSTQDITKQKQARLALEKTEEKLRNVVEHSTNLFYAHDTDGVLSFVSPQSIHFLGCEPEEAMRRWTDFVTDHPVNEKGFQNTLKAIETGEAQQPYDLQLRRDDGRMIWVEVNEAPLVADGTTVGIVGSLTDITDRRNFEKRLISVNKMLESAQKIAKVGSWEIDLSRKNKVYWSDMAKLIFGEDPGIEPILEKTFDFYEPESRETFQNAIYNAMNSGGSFDLELLINTRSGNKKWIRTIAEVEEKNGKPVKILGSIQDINDRKEWEEQLKEMNLELEKHAKELAVSNAELEQFAYVASHDLQEPLRMVSSFLTQLEKKYSEQLDDKAMQYIHFAVDGARRMRQIILDLLNYSRVGKKTYLDQEIPLNRVLEEISVLEQSLIRETGGKITWNKLPVIKGAEIPIQQLFQNLINNGLKYHKPGTKPEIQITCIESNDHWKFSVADNGIGIDEQFQENIFTIFHRLHTQDEFAGTGIGLAVAKKIVENHGGSIWVESQESKGSTFYFTIKKPQ